MTRLSLCCLSSLWAVLWITLCILPSMVQAQEQQGNSSITLEADGSNTSPPTIQQVMTLRAGVMNAPPFATISRSPISGELEYGGFQVDLLRSFPFWAARDSILLTLDLSPAPTDYTAAFDLVANDCDEERAALFGNNTSPDGSSSIYQGDDSEEWNCDSFDVMIADFYATADRSERADLSPPWLHSATSTVKYKAKTIQPQLDFVTTIAQAMQVNATVCMQAGTYYSRVLKEQFPTLPFLMCRPPAACIENLKEEKCILYADDELMLRSQAANDPTLEITPESFNTQYIVWALRQENPLFRWITKWIYDARANGTIDDLYSQYFSKQLCSIGKAGESCELPCDPNHGQADAFGRCICISTKWTGEDCSMEVLENKNYIPQGLKIVAWVIFGINSLTIIACAAWLWLKRKTNQVLNAQPTLLCLVLLGCLISSATLIFLAQEDDNVKVEEQEYGVVVITGQPHCMLIPWFYSVGFSITFGTLFAKIWRTYTIFKCAVPVQRQRVTVFETVAVTGAVLMLDVVVLMTWTMMDPLVYERTIVSEDKFGSPLESEGYCTSEYWPVWIGLVACIHLFLLAVASCLCYVSRDIPTELSEGKYVSIAMFSNLQIFVVAVPILLVMGSTPKASFFVQSVVIGMNDLVVVVCVFGNLFYQYYCVTNDYRAEEEAAAINGSRQERAIVQPNRTPNPRKRQYASRRQTRTSILTKLSEELSSSEDDFSLGLGGDDEMGKD